MPSDPRLASHIKMNTLRVWAPKPAKVALEIANQRLPMRLDESGGWWSIETELTAPGADYAFILDDGKPFPDPRSPSQPGGVHGRSRVINHGSFRWSDVHWNPPPLSSGIIYE